MEREDSDHIVSHFTSLDPSNVDPTVAIAALETQHGLLLNLIRHCLPSLANSLFVQGIISRDVYERAFDTSLTRSERGVALLDSVKSGIEESPSDFIKVVHIIEKEPFLESLSKDVVKSYCTMYNESAISVYRVYLKTVYKNCLISPDAKWPPTPSRQFINLVLVKGGHRHGYSVGQDNTIDIALMQNEISIEQLLEQEGQNKLKLILVEGAPGIGKSALVWELCRKWEEFVCMQQYSLVILLRLREEEVQKITNMSQLFFSYTSDNDTLVQEVLRGHGKGILFILDGFDELPKQLQQKGFLLNLIGGNILPESTVLVTSKPSATGELLTSCRRQIQKHVEILGFTQEAVHAYASSIFSCEPKELEKFKAYISANPAINSLMYIPLNAAIIVTIYRNYKPGNSILPHTLTELYTQLCLTVLDRYLKIDHPWVIVKKFEDLPPDLYRQFLHLSEMAFEGFKNEGVIFHSVPSDLIHFGFLDAVSALYGGGTVSYNFLHLTIQEYLAAYYLSNLGSATEVLQRCGKNQRWNVVWRFVAGLTKFEQYEGHFDRSLFVHEAIREGFYHLKFNLFFFQCLFEAQSMKYFYSALESSSTTAAVEAAHLSSLDAYAIGYCISNFPIGISSWRVTINYSSHHSFRHGLNSALCGHEVELYGTNGQEGVKVLPRDGGEIEGPIADVKDNVATEKVADNPTGIDDAEKAEFIKNIEDDIASKKPVDRKLAHSILVGPPGSGKSSLMIKLLRKPKKAFPGSTGFSESVVVIDIDVDSSFHAAAVIDPHTWKEVEFDTSLVRQMGGGIVNSPPVQAKPSEEVTIRQSQPTVTSISESGGPPTLPTANFASTSESATISLPTANSISVSERKSTHSSEALKPIKLSGTKCRAMIDAAIEKCGGYKKFSKSYSKSFSLYMRDTGGHMAFQEMLSVLILGPSIFIFVFRMDFDLKKRFAVEYRVGPKKSLNCTTSSITTEESLLQFLASVYAMDAPANASIKIHKPQVFIVGTHKDKLDELGASARDEKIAEINDHLDSLIDSHSCFQGLVQYADEDNGQVMFTVNNNSESDEDFKSIRSRIHEYVSKRSEFTIKYPVSYLLFSLELQHEQCSVLSFEECESIASKYGIVGDEVSRVLQFLHFRVGIIQYFSKEGLVMIKPQVLFSKVTGLVKKTFSQEFLTREEKLDFKNGILTTSLIEDVVKEDDIASKLFKQLLIRLHIITPFTLPGEQEQKYFMPCVLKHVQESNEKELHTNIFPLSVQFKCKHCPKGLFGVLVTYLMEDSSCQTTFALMKEKIFRDQISFEVNSHYDEDEMTLKAFHSHLEIHFFPSSYNENREVPIGEVRNTIRQVVETSILKSLEYLCYTEDKVGPMMCFKCNSCHELHPVKLNKRTNCHKIFCKKHRIPSSIPPAGRWWYNEADGVASSSQQQQQQQLGSPRIGASQTRLNERDHFRIVYDQLRPHLARWRDIGIGLHFIPSELDIIQASPAHFPNAPSSYMCAMLAQWLHWAPGDDRGSTGHATLESLKRAVDEAGLGVDAQRLHI